MKKLTYTQVIYVEVWYIKLIDAFHRIDILHIVEREIGWKM